MATLMVNFNQHSVGESFSVSSPGLTGTETLFSSLDTVDFTSFDVSDLSLAAHGLLDLDIAKLPTPDELAKAEDERQAEMQATGVVMTGDSSLTAGRMDVGTAAIAATAAMTVEQKKKEKERSELQMFLLMIDRRIGELDASISKLQDRKKELESDAEKSEKDQSVLLTQIEELDLLANDINTRDPDAVVDNKTRERALRVGVDKKHCEGTFRELGNGVDRCRQDKCQALEAKQTEAKAIQDEIVEIDTELVKRRVERDELKAARQEVKAEMLNVEAGQSSDAELERVSDVVFEALEKKNVVEVDPVPEMPEVDNDEDKIAVAANVPAAGFNFDSFGG